MKTMQSVSRGAGFAGVLQYVEGADKKTGKTHGRLIGGNMASTDIKTMGKEYGSVRELRPDIAKPVWHQSLRLPAGERATDEKLNEASQLFMKKMGFSDLTQYSVWKHDDPEGLHVHLVVNRVGLDGKVWLGQNENLIGTRVVQEIEIELDFQITKGPEYDPVTGKIVMPERAKNKKNEEKMSGRLGVYSPKKQIQMALDEVLKFKPSPEEFIEALKSAGVVAMPNIASTGKMSGFSFELDSINFKASQLGKQYAWQRLQGMIDYDENRDKAFLIDHRAKNQAEAGRDRPSDGNSPVAISAIPEQDRPASTDDCDAGRADTEGTGGGRTDKNFSIREIIRRTIENKEAERRTKRENRRINRDKKQADGLDNSKLRRGNVHRTILYRRAVVQVRLISRELVRRLKAMVEARKSMSTGFNPVKPIRVIPLLDEIHPVFK